jgi:hypothetical protein
MVSISIFIKGMVFIGEDIYYLGSKFFETSFVLDGHK